MLYSTTVMLTLSEYSNCIAYFMNHRLHNTYYLVPKRYQPGISVSEKLKDRLGELDDLEEVQIYNVDSVEFFCLRICFQLLSTNTFLFYTKTIERSIS